MKPTDEERRAVAKRLRNNADQNRRWVVPWAVFNDADEHGDIELNNRLADLIEPEPERTCRDEKRYRDDDSPPWPYYVCSECGASFCYVDVATEEGDESSERLPYCPGCGAKVVD